MRTPTRSLAAALTAVAMLGISPVVPAAAVTPTQPITWEYCPDQVTDPTAECGRVDVPMQHSDPDGPEISVGFVWIPAAEESARRGTLFGNPGGPGGDAYTYFDEGAGIFTWPEAIVNEWDRVAVQPRGMSGSSPVSCDGDTADVGFLDPYIREGAYIRDVCEEPDGYTESLTTSNTVEDWEWVRAALEEEKISLIGVSYGTFLGSAYASRYPQHTDRVVLDSAPDSDLAWNGILAAQQVGYENALHDFMAWAAERNMTYGLGETPFAVYEAWARSVGAETGARPTVVPPAAGVDDLPTGLGFTGEFGVSVMNRTAPFFNTAQGLTSQLLTGGNQGYSELLDVTRSTIPTPSEWDSLARMINGTKPLPSYDATIEGMTDEEEEDMATSEIMQALLMCNENEYPANPMELPEYYWNAYVTGDIFTSSNVVFTSGASCAGAEPVDTLPDMDGSALATRPLLIQGTGDPQTPYGGHTTLAEAMDAHVVTVHGPGHGHAALENDAVDELVIEYLRTGRTDITDVDGIAR